MRFHHSTRRGRHRSAPSHHQLSSSTRWSQLNHCRETNIYFSRRLPVEYPAAELSVDKCRHQLESVSVKEGRHERLAAKGEQPTSMDLESLREKLVAQVQKHPFWSNKAAKRMQIKSVKRRNIYIYELESYCERRDLEWRFESYRGGLSAGSIVPYRINQLPATSLNSTTFAAAAAAAAAGSSSQPATPVSRPASCVGANIHQFARSGCNQRQTGPASDKSAPSSAPAALPINKPSSLVLYEPASAKLEQLIPSADYLWSIDVRGSQQQQQQQRGRRLLVPSCVSTEVPNSSFVKKCHGCQGRGKLKCNLCHGVGYEVCLSCSGKGTTRSYSAGSSGRTSGYTRSCDRSSASHYDTGEPDASYRGLGSSAPDANSRNSRHANGEQSSGLGSSLGGWFQESCTTCHGAGQKRCWVCAGKSYNNCPGCLGTGSLRCYLTLTVSWLSHCDDVIINNSDSIIPKERLRVCSGISLVDQVEDRLHPLDINAVASTTSLNIKEPDETLSSYHSSQQPSGYSRSEAEQLQLASKHLLEKHRHSYRGEKFLKQRHKVTQIECHIVKYEWKQRHGQFVIYGEDRKVYIGKYPFKSICNII